ncbi:alpha/beta-hydrolase [Pterulicium gracile]|uniref:Dipeptidyl-peptidase V n=1 Tax=Pterulicium gracile TaxID=1884261 RepID=A0A5C3QLV0_9AGAR|nr:alpha/beta-hydrolase [Pterula gracilis]
MTTDYSLKQGGSIFSPVDLITLGRPGAGVANPAGDLVLVPFSEYSFEDERNSKSIWLAPLQSKHQPFQVPLAKGGEAFWLDARTIAHAVESEGDDKVLELYAISVKFETQLSADSTPKLIGTFPTAGATNFRYSAEAGRLVFSDYVYADGDLTKAKENDKMWEKRGNTALVYDTTFEREWDTWVLPKTKSLFSVTLKQNENKEWALGSEWTNALHGTGHSAPVEPFGGTDDFDISTKSIVYTTKDAKLPPAWHTKQNVYITDIDGSGKPRELTSGKHGATHFPIFSSKQDKVAWLELDRDGYESDRAKVVIYDLEKDVKYTLTQKWDRSPDGMTFSKDDKILYLTVGDHAKVKVFALPVPPTPSSSTTHPDLDKKYTSPIALTRTGSASGIQLLHDGSVVFTKGSLTSPNDVFIIRDLKSFEESVLKGDQPEFRGKVEQITRFTEEKLKDKHLSPGEEFWFEGAEGKKVQGWTLKPPGFKEGEKKKWPVLLLIHGGPQGAWEDGWSSRWNPNVFASQGYFVVAMNPSGSTTFGQEFTDSIAENWGGKPFEDMRLGWKHILKNHQEVDPERAVAAGASWGGYAINWIQGHPEYGFNFKALVCHDGVFDVNYNGYSTDELFFFNHEWGGRPWEKKPKELFAKYNPIHFVDKWGTPQLIIHGSKDYRLPETEGIGAFHALQQQGIPSRLVIFPDENHWVLKHGNSLKWHTEVFRWFDKYAGEGAQ